LNKLSEPEISLVIISSASVDDGFPKIRLISANIALTIGNMIFAGILDLLKDLTWIERFGEAGFGVATQQKYLFYILFKESIRMFTIGYI
jgi:hypothetical protein